MVFYKLGELIDLSPTSVQDANSVTPIIDENLLKNFQKQAANLKRIAPKAEDFLYFSAVMMHAAEASTVNEDGTPKMTSKGETVKANWDRTGGSWRWKTNDPNIKPYKNSNGDIFPEEELVKAYKKWVGKPLCIDHKSSSVDHVRGFIVDTYYDRQLKRVIALCALDKHNYPDLARKVSTGYSNSVSMGTAVGKAICSDCGTIAKTEADFCKCMRGRTCYGEINVDLSPIELSIVVNGADPQAKIKHVIAAQLEALNTYVSVKEAEIKKLADYKYNATLSFNDPGGQEGRSGNVNLEAGSLDELKAQVQKSFEDFERISKETEKMSENTNDVALNQTASTVAMDETDLSATDQSLAPPVDRFATDDINLGAQLKVIKSKLESMQSDLNKLSQQVTRSSNIKQEENMSGSKDNNLNKQAYFQGGGEGNEPTPGKSRYEKDPLNEQLRNNEDKQMVGQSPFPEVGPTDGMHPSPSSVDQSNELERKKMLLRAETEGRSLNRQAVVNSVKDRLEKIKQGYFQGGGDGNDPTPGKNPYPVDKLQTTLRDKEDKQMVGQSPFPGVGNVDGLHPSPSSADQKDELKRKELLQRADTKLTARFVKAAKEDGSHDMGKSAWQVFQGEKLLLTATVDAMTRGNSEKLYHTVATTECGKDLIAKVRAIGADKTASLFKVAQDSGAITPAAPPGDAPGAPPASPAGPTDAAGPADGAGDADGDPKDKAVDLAQKAQDVVSDLNEAVRALTGEQAEMGSDDMPMSADDSADKVSTAQLQGMRKNLNSMLLSALGEAAESLANQEEELRSIASLYESGKVNDANKGIVAGLASESFVEAQAGISESMRLLGAFVKYARSTQEIVKRATQSEFNKTANGDPMAPGYKEDGLMNMVNDSASSEEHETMSAEDALDAMLAEDMESANFEEESADDNNAGTVTTSDPAKAAELANKGLEVHVASENLDTTTKEGRVAARAKLAAEMKWNPVINDFHKHLEDPTFDVKPSDNGGHVETIDEIHEVLLDVANAPPKVRKDAEAINQLVISGQLAKDDVDLLASYGVDPDAVKYWKQFYGEMGSEGSQFATELVKEHVKAQAEEDMSKFRVKLARAYELTYDMVNTGLLDSSKGSINRQVDEIMKWNDESFDSVKRVIASQTPVAKTAGRIPQVGILGTGDSSASETEDFASQLDAAFSRSGKRMF